MLSSVTWRRKNQRKKLTTNKDRAVQTKARIKKEVLMTANLMKMDTSLSKMYLPPKLRIKLLSKRRRKGNCVESLSQSQIDSLNIRPS